MNDDKIDFVVLWVDGSDPEWLKEKLKYQGIENVDTDDIQNAISRYRDMGILKYWFRGVEKYAPWVNNIFFVTWGHIPDFLNTNNPKIIINHKDFIDNQYLPLFNSSAIEMNIFKIKDLSEQFVYFNDDMFITKPVSKEDFFLNELPRGYSILSPIIPDTNFSHNIINDIILINNSFDMNKVIKEQHKKFYSLKYGKDLLRTLFLKQWGKLCGFKESHLAHAYLKSSFEECYRIYKNEFELTWSHKFRHEKDITNWLVEYWQYMNGIFEPISPNIGKLYGLGKNNEELLRDIENQKYRRKER